MTSRLLVVAPLAAALLLGGCVTATEPSPVSGEPAVIQEATLPSVESVYVNYDNGRVLLRWSPPKSQRDLGGYRVLVDGLVRHLIRTPDRESVDIGPLTPLVQHDITVIPVSRSGRSGESFTLQVYLNQGPEYPEPSYAFPSQAGEAPATPEEPLVRRQIDVPAQGEAAPTPDTAPAPSAEPTPTVTVTVTPTPSSSPTSSPTPTPTPTSTPTQSVPGVTSASALGCQRLTSGVYLHRFEVLLSGGSGWFTQGQSAPLAAHRVDAYTNAEEHTLTAIWIARGPDATVQTEPDLEIPVPATVSSCAAP